MLEDVYVLAWQSRVREGILSRGHLMGKGTETWNIGCGQQEQGSGGQHQLARQLHVQTYP